MDYSGAHRAKGCFSAVICFTRIILSSSFYDLSDVFESLRVVLQAVVRQGDVVGQRCQKGSEKEEEKTNDERVKSHFLSCT